MQAVEWLCVSEYLCVCVHLNVCDCKCVCVRDLLVNMCVWLYVLYAYVC